MSDTDVDDFRHSYVFGIDPWAEPIPWAFLPDESRKKWRALYDSEAHQ